MTTTQRPTAASWEVTELRQVLLVLSNAPDVVGSIGTLAPSSMRVTYRRSPGAWVIAAVDLLGMARDHRKPAVLEVPAAAALGPAWIRALADQHRPPL